ncbi:MAG: hypothetical protein KC464_01930 [Myxococcales bacterium]|nr:hypothetical protein [Myxococcales bacterium]
MSPRSPLLALVAALAVGCTAAPDAAPDAGVVADAAAALDAYPAVCGNDIVEPGEGCEPGPEQDPRCTSTCRIAPGASIPLSTGGREPYDVTVGGGQVYWTERDGGREVRRLDLDGTAAGVVDTGNDWPVAIAFHDALYVGRQSQRDVVRRDGATLAPACSGAGASVWAITGGPDRLYVSVYGNGVVACRYTSTAPRVIGLDFDATAIAAAPDGLYLLGTDRTLRRMSYDDETVAEIQSIPGANDLAADDAHVYYLTSGGDVVALPLGGGATQVLGNVGAGGVALAVDDGAVYVADRIGLAIVKFPRP